MCVENQAQDWHWHLFSTGPNSQLPQSAKGWRGDSLLPLGNYCWEVTASKWYWLFKDIQSIVFLHPQVPQLYKMKGYQPFSTQKASVSYRPQKLARSLKQGAEVTCLYLQELLSLSPLILVSRLTSVLGPYTGWSHHHHSPSKQGLHRALWQVLHPEHEATRGLSHGCRI
jgi:hypothetical protein